MRFPPLFSLFAAAVFAAACHDGTSPPATASVVISPDTASVVEGQRVTFTAHVLDANGHAIRGKSITWTTANPLIAAPEEPGTFLGMVDGTTTITATADGKSGTATLTVLVPVANVAVTLAGNAPPRVGLGQKVQMATILTDAAGKLLGTRAATWSSSAPNVASMDTSGLLTGVTAGTTTITATVEGKTGALAITVTSGQAPTIAAISPATLTPGASVKITGTNFDAAMARDTVTVGGVSATITSASATELDVALSDAYPCFATQNGWVVVTTAAGSGTAQQTIQVSTPVALQVGQTAMLTDKLTRCVELPSASGRYMVDVLNATTVPSAIAAFQVRGAAGPAPSTAASIAPTLARSPIMKSFTLPSSPFTTQMQQRARAHAATMDRNRRVLRRFGSPLAALRTRARASRDIAPATTTTWNGMTVPLTVGATATLKYRPPGVDGCDSGIVVSPRVAWVGTHSVILEEAGGPFTGRMDADYADLGKTFDNVVYPMLLANFGDPLVLDSLLDNNQRLVMYFTKRVNTDTPGDIAYVASCDFFPASTPGVAASNAGELFYGMLPVDTTNNYFDDATRVGWRYGMKAVLAHETKHIVSMAAHIANSAQYWEEGWLEEGTAQISTEIFARTLYGGAMTWKGNARYASTVGCDARPLTCGSALGTYDLFAWLYQYYQENETKTFFNSPAVDGVIYGSGWWFARWAADNYATSEGDFFKAITQEPLLTGLDNVAARTGRPFAEMLANFTLALATDDLAGFIAPADAKYTFPSWNSADVWSGYSADFRVPVPSIAHPVSFGTFSQGVDALNGGAAAIFDVSGSASGKQVIGLYTANGGPLPAQSPLRIAILRIQ